MKRKKRRSGRPTKGQWGFMLLFGLVPLILHFLIMVMPAIQALATSFYEWSGYGDKGYVGWENYIAILKDKVFYKAMINDVIILIFKELIILVLSVTFAVSVTRLYFKKSETNILRFIYYLPNIISGVVIAKIWKYFFDLELFSLITGLNTPEQGWITTYPLQIITFVASWCGIGGFMIILIAAINNIPKDVYEAAELDGAGQFRQLFAITLPYIRPQLKLIFITILTGIIPSNMNFVKLFIGEGLGGSGFTVMGLYEYTYGFTYYKLGYAYAVAVILMIVVFVISYVFNYGFSKKEDK